LFLASPVFRSIKLGGSFPAGDWTTRARSFRSTVARASTGSLAPARVALRFGVGALRCLPRLTAGPGVRREPDRCCLGVAFCRRGAVEEASGREVDIEPDAERRTDPIDSLCAVTWGSAGVRRSPRSPGSLRAIKTPSAIRPIRQKAKSANRLTKPRARAPRWRCGDGSGGRGFGGNAFWRPMAAPTSASEGARCNRRARSRRARSGSTSTSSGVIGSDMSFGAAPRLAPISVG